MGTISLPLIYREIGLKVKYKQVLKENKVTFTM